MGDFDRGEILPESQALEAPRHETRAKGAGESAEGGERRQLLGFGSARRFVVAAVVARGFVRELAAKFEGRRAGIGGAGEVRGELEAVGGVGVAGEREGGFVLSEEAVEGDRPGASCSHGAFGLRCF